MVHQASPIPKWISQRIGKFKCRKGIVWYTLLSTPTHLFLPKPLVNFCCKCLSCLHYYLTDWGREPLSMQSTYLSSQRVEYINGRPLSMQPTKTSVIRFFMMGHWWGTPSNMLRTVGSQGASIQHVATRIRSGNWLVTCFARNADNTREINAWGANA